MILDLQLASLPEIAAHYESDKDNWVRANMVISQDGLNALGGEANLWTLPGLAQTPAGRNKQVLAIDDMALLGFSVRTPEAIQQLRAKAELLP